MTKALVDKEQRKHEKGRLLSEEQLYQVKKWVKSYLARHGFSKE